MDKRPKAKHISNGVIVSWSQSFKHCSRLDARPSKTTSIRHKTKPPSLHVVSSPTAWAHGLLMFQHYRPNPEPLSSLSLSLSIDLSSVTFTFSLLHPLTHPPSCRPFILLTRDGSDQLSVESGGASSELGDAGICMACFVLHQCLWVGLQHPLQWKHGGQSSYHHWCFFWDWRGTDHYSLIICPFCLHFFFLLLGVVVYENGLFLEHIHHVNDFWFCGNQGIFLWWILIYIYIYHFYGFSKWWN